MFARLINRFETLTQSRLVPHIAASAVAFGAFQWVQARLNASYAASNHPVDYMTGQLAFSAEKIEGYYAVMEGAGTLDVYLRTQIIDYGFILGTAIVGLLLGSLVARLAVGRGPVFWGGFAVAALAVLGACFDALENLVSFVMLANPAEIKTGVATVYSSFAAAKFACLMPATTLFFVVLAAGIIVRGVAFVRRPAAAV